MPTHDLATNAPADADPPDPISTPQVESGVAGSAELTGLGRVAARVSNWTTNLLVTAVIVFVALTLGAKLTRFWHVDETSGPPLRVADLDSTFAGPGEAVRLTFGRSPVVMFRQTFLGDQSAAAEELCQACGARLAESALPENGIGEAEAALLARLDNQAPLQQTDDGARLHKLEYLFPAVVGTMPLPGGDAAVASNGGNSRRVVVWGLAVPNPQDGWTLYAFAPGAESSEPGGQSKNGSAGPFPVPPQADHLMSIRSVGGAVTTFKGTDGPDTWSSFYDTWCMDHGWRSLIAWRQTADRWHARFAHEGDEATTTVDVQFSRAPTTDESLEMWRGVVTATDRPR